MSRIDERLEIMGVDTSEMTTEEKFTAATGLTRYDEEIAANDWYVPAGAANTPDEASEESGEQGQTSQSEPTGEQTGSSEPTGEQTGQNTPTGEQTGQNTPTGEPTGQTSQAEPTGEPTGSSESTNESETETTGEHIVGPTGDSGEPSTVDVETGETGE